MTDWETFAFAAVQKVEDRTRVDVAHDQGHLWRVLRLARSIATAEGPHDADVITVAAIMHDIITIPKNDPDRPKASLISAGCATRILLDAGFPHDRLAQVSHAIIAHSFSAQIEPLTPEAKALQDADRIDALGAIGVARCFAVSALLGRALVDPFDPLAKQRPLDESMYVLDHFQTKLLKLPETMCTQTGRRIAADRAVFIRQFIQQIADEMAGLG
jgi:uncharacterized protein